MNRRATTWLAWGLFSITVLLCIATLTIMVLFSTKNTNLETRLYQIMGSLWPIVFAVVGALIMSRLPRHVIGWLLMALGLTATVTITTSLYLEYGVERRLGLSGTDPVVIGLTDSSYAIGTAMFTFLFLLFPSGKLLSPRWRVVAWLAAIFHLSYIPVTILSPITMRNGQPEPNLIGISGPVGDLLAALLTPLFMLQISMLLGAVVSLAIRFWRARGEERQQLKWLAPAGVLFALTALIGSGGWAWVLQNIAIATMPLAIGIAILRYRLYAIDVIIRRTLIYSILTAFLLAVYIAGVVLLQGVFRSLMGQESQLAVASTLAIAGLFQPIRRRIQDVIDRHFYRRKYDAAQVLAQFAATARDEVDLDRLTDQLLTVVEDTMQPAHVSIWLKPRQKG